MRVETEKLVSVGTYAKMIERDRSRVYQMIQEGKLDIVKIDNITFVKHGKNIG